MVSDFKFTFLTNYHLTCAYYKTAKEGPITVCTILSTARSDEKMEDEMAKKNNNETLGTRSTPRYI